MNFLPDKGLRFLNHLDLNQLHPAKRINRTVKHIDYIHSARIMLALGIDPRTATFEECQQAVAEAQAEYLPHVEKSGAITHENPGGATELRGKI